MTRKRELPRAVLFFFAPGPKPMPKTSRANPESKRYELVQEALEGLIAAFNRCQASSQGALFAEHSGQVIYQSAVILFLRLTFLTLAQQRHGLNRSQEKLFQQFTASLKQTHPRVDSWSLFLQLSNSVPWLPPLSRAPSPPLTLRRCPLPEDPRLQVQSHELALCLQALDAFSDGDQLPIESLGSIYESTLEQSIVKVEERSVLLKRPGKRAALQSFDSLRQLFESRPQTILNELRHTTGRPRQSLQRDLDACLEALRSPLDTASKNPAQAFAPLLKTTKGGAVMVLEVGSLHLVQDQQRRQSGTHYTPPALTKQVVRETLSEFTKAPKIPISQRRVCDIAMGSGAFVLEACRYLAELAQSTSKAKKSEAEWKEEVAKYCLYGVDVNPLAADIARCSLWLEVANPSLPLSFLDEHFKVGDSVLGFPVSPDSLSIKDHHWLPQIREQLRPYLSGSFRRDEQEKVAADLWIALQMRSSKAKRMRSYEEWQRLCKAQSSLARLRLFVAKTLNLGKQDQSQEAQCFHWPLEFPEILEGESSGFDAIIGNPPFLGGRNISASFGKDYNRWLTALHPGSSGEADLVAHFLRRAWDLLKPNGLIGIVAKDIISQGETRLAGLQQLIGRGATIFKAETEILWPGPAAVSISLLHLVKGPWSGRFLLNKKEVDEISSFLGQDKIAKEPVPLGENKNKAFQGVIPHSTGFEFKKNGDFEQSFEFMQQLITENPRNSELIHPYIGGEDLNESPQLQPSRFIINFGDRTEDEAREWPQLFSLIERRVKPDRLSSKSKEVNEYPFWKYWRQRKKLYKAIEGQERVLATNAQASIYLCFAFLDGGSVFQNSLNIFPFADDASFAVLQSSFHNIYAWFLCSNLGAGIRYNPTACFVTFPFPENWTENSSLNDVGRRFYRAREALMIAEEIGLTKLYDRFHSPADQSPVIQELRELQSKLDEAVMTAFHWRFDLEHGFYDLGYGQRYIVSPKARRTILAALLELNEQRSHRD